MRRTSTRVRRCCRSSAASTPRRRPASTSSTASNISSSPCSRCRCRRSRSTAVTCGPGCSKRSTPTTCVPPCQGHLGAPRHLAPRISQRADTARHLLGDRHRCGRRRSHHHRADLPATRAWASYFLSAFHRNVDYPSAAAVDDGRGSCSSSCSTSSRTSRTCGSTRGPRNDLKYSAHENTSSRCRPTRPMTASTTTVGARSGRRSRSRRPVSRGGATGGTSSR